MCRSHHSTTATAISQVDTGNDTIHVQYSVPYTASIWGRQVKNMAHSVLARKLIFWDWGEGGSMIFSKHLRWVKRLKKKKHRLLEYYLYDPVSNVFLLAYGRLQVHNKSAKTLYLNDFHSLKYVSPSYFCFYPIITITNKTLTLCLCFIPKCTVYGTTERKN